MRVGQQPQHRVPSGGTLVIDAHGHGTRMLPRPISALRRASVRSHPADSPLTDLAPAGVDGLIVNAVGDRLVTRWRWPADPWVAVRRQLDELRSEAESAGCRLATTTADIQAAHDAGRPAVVLGLEGADVVGEDPTRVSVLHGAGVRVIGLVHFADNALGTIAMSWNGQAFSPAVRSGWRAPGLTARGAEVVAEMNAAGVLIDVAHADLATTVAICARTAAPVICSHTGARSLHDFPRFLSDEEVRAIVATGGLVGLWPFRYKGNGIADQDDFARHADHLARTAGADHVCIGTDMNGVPGLMAGYQGERDFPILTQALRRAGFSDAEVAGIAGGNMARILASVCR
jgi:microsomal dipeptidase-like Zn-dependent dipeptidase